MSSSLLPDEEEGGEPEITLSTASLLGLFVCLVLICGVFFGFGYSMGRRSNLNGIAGIKTNPPEASVPSAAKKFPEGISQDALNETSSTALNGLPLDQAPLPSAHRTSADAANADNVVEPLHSPKDAIMLPTVEKPIPLPAEQQKVQNAGQTLAQVSRAASTGTPQTSIHVMVQVAAVIHQEDAEVLVSALRQHGYTALVRTEPQDKFLHVQVGPFVDRAQAISTRQKLLSDGYAAILKQ